MNTQIKTWLEKAILNLAQKRLDLTQKDTPYLENGKLKWRKGYKNGYFKEGYIKLFKNN